jgi:DNA-directed RNA polymerase
MLSPSPHQTLPLLTLEEAQAHPLWEAQVNLERGMLREGAERFRDTVVLAKERGKMTRLEPVRGLISEWLPKVAQTFSDWRRTMKTTRGVKPIAFQYLAEADPFVVNLVGLQVVLDGIATDRQHVTPLAIAIGRQIEHELQVREWEAKDPALFHDLRKWLDREKVTSDHRGRVNIHRFNALLKEGKLSFDWQRWDQEVQFRVGVVILENLVRATNWFELVPDPSHVFKPGQKKGPKQLFVAREGLIEWLGKQLDAAEVTHPAYMPTLIPPRRWDGTRSGGYWTPYVIPPALVKFKASQREQGQRAADEYDALAMPKVMDALHFLQEVPWRVNHRVYEVAQWVIETDMGMAGVPSTKGAEEVPKPVDIETNEEARKQWKRVAKSSKMAAIKRLSKLRNTSRTYRVAMELHDRERFYFPHMLDFRGRCYPIPAGLQPQGNDFAKGLLEFADGKPVTVANGGVRWLAIQVASWWGEGKDKVSFEDREQWVREQEPLWRRIAHDPYSNLEWADADKPFQALAAIFDWVGYLDHGDGYVSHAPVAVDGTCNGIQHLSAATRDKVAGAYVNLVPGTKPRDIYKFVAETLQREVERLAASRGEPGEYARYWLDLCKGDLPRSLLKRPVMVLPYGGSRDAFFKYTQMWLDEQDPLPPDAPREAWSLRGKRLHWLVGLMWDAVNASVTGAMVVMKWLQDCARKTASRNQPLFWVTPSGFVVRHFYGKQDSRKVEVMFSGERVQVRLNTTTKDLDTKSQLTGIPPNFVHSQDAATLVLTIVKAKSCGIAAFTAVHDAYGSHGADMDTVAKCLREAFVEVHSQNVLSQFRAACQSVVAAMLIEEQGLDPLEAQEKAGDMLPPLPPMGELDIAQVLASDYFFA